MLKQLVLASVLLGVGVVVWRQFCCGPPPVPHFDEQAWWGPLSTKGRVDTSIRPFQVKFSDAMIKDLKERLAQRRTFTKPLEGIKMEYGFNTNDLDPLLKYWQQNYNFTERERYLNKFPQYKTNIQGLDIHFIHVKPTVQPGVEVIPVLMMHGWPGSVREFYEAIPLLSQPRDGYDFAIELVVPSLPGYGFSDPAVRPGLGAAEIAVVLRNLMRRLGHEKFYVQGGDWGAAIASILSTVYPDDVLGHHTNAPFILSPCALLKLMLGSFVPSWVVDPALADRIYPLGAWFQYMVKESGYFHLQATKPDTVGVGLTDSPSGLAAYILEKFASWTIKNGNEIPNWLSKDGLFDNLMIYWSTNSITTSVRLYSETMNNRHRAFNLDAIPSSVPTWAIQAKNEIIYMPESIIKMKYPNLIHVNNFEKGGHFLAFEFPKEFSNDVWKALKAFRKWNKDKKTKKNEL